MSTPWLSLLVFVPLAGMFAVLALGRSKEICRWISLGTSLAVFGISVMSLSAFLGGNHGQVVIGAPDPATNATFQSVLHEKAHWFSVAGLEVNYELDVDGFSMLMIVLTGLIAVSAAIASWNIDRAPMGYHAMLNLLVCAMMGTFVSMDLFLFYVFWELMLLPMYFLIGVWGGPRREYAAIKFFIYTLVGSVLILAAFLALYFDSSARGAATLSIPTLLSDAAEIFRGNGTIRTALFFALFLGFAVKVPVWPFHTWLPDAHVEAPTPISVILAAVLLKMGGYGLIRMAWPLFPEIVIENGAFLASLAVISIVYGALVAMAQKDWKKLVAYSSVSHMGYVLLGLVCLNETSIDGAILQMFNHGTISGMMFLLVGVMYDRVHHRDLDRFGGILGMLPKYSVMAMIGFFASLGLPGLSGFISEVMVFLGSFNGTREIATANGGIVTVMPHAKFFTIAATLGVVFGAVYILTMLQKVFLGKPKEVGGHGHDAGHDSHGAAPAAAMAPNPGHGGHDDAHAAGGHGGGGGGHDQYEAPKAPWPDLLPNEWAALLPLAAVTIFLGILPGVALRIFNPTVIALVDRMNDVVRRVAS